MLFNSDSVISIYKIYYNNLTNNTKLNKHYKIKETQNMLIKHVTVFKAEHNTLQVENMFILNIIL